MTTPNLQLSEMPSNSLQPSAPFNASMQALDALVQLSVETITATPPTTTSADVGKRWIVGTGATGVWAGKDNQVALCTAANTWTYYVPQEGWRADVRDEDAQYRYDGATWALVASGGGSFTGGALTTALDEAKAADIASAATTDIGAAAGNFVHVTGTTPITSLGTAQAGARRIVRFAGALTLTHNATSLILPTGANITTAANDVAEFVSEGSGNWRCTGYLRADGTALAGGGGGGGGLTNITEAIATASPYNTINLISLSATGGSTNASFAIVPKGSGAFQLSTGGNARGSNAIDLQMVRGSSAQVASGAASFLAGQNNTASSTGSCAIGESNSAVGASSVALGYLNTASSSQAVAIGRNNTASGSSSSAIGESNSANAAYSSCRGREAGATGVIGKHAFASGYITRVAGNQGADYVLRGTTNNATPVTLTTDASAASTNNQIILSDSSAFVVRGTVIARSQTSGDVAAWEVTAVIKRESGAASVALVGSATVTQIAASAGASGWACTVTADATNGGLKIEGTGAASTTVRWNAVMRANELITA